MKYHQVMAAADRQYQAMRSESYTVLTEGDKNDRLVHCGEVHTQFSKVQGGNYKPSAGLGLQRWDAEAYQPIC